MAALWLGFVVAMFVFWSGTYDFGFRSIDFLHNVSAFKSARGAGELLAFIAKPHNDHVTPVYKAFLYLEFRAFGMKPSPYHTVSILLMCASAFLLYGFVLREGVGRPQAAAITAVYSFNSYCYTLMSAVYQQQFVLTMILMLLSLRLAQEHHGSSGMRNHNAVTASAGLAFLASITLKMGAIAPVAGALYVAATHGGERRRLARKLLPYALSATATFAAYVLLGTASSEGYGHRPGSPAFYASGMVIMLGTYVAKSVLGNLLLLLADASDDKALLPFIIAGFAALAAGLAAGPGKAPAARQRRLFILWAGLALAATASTLAFRADYFELDAYRVSTVRHYLYFPGTFILLAAACVPVNPGRLMRAVLIAALPVWLAIGMYSISGMHARELGSINALNSALQRVERSVDYPISIDERGVIAESAQMNTGSRPVRNFDWFGGEGRTDYFTLLRIFLPQDSFLYVLGDNALLLRNMRGYAPAEIEADPAGAAVAQGDTLSVRSEAPVTLRFPLGGMSADLLPVLSVNIRADRAALISPRCEPEAGMAEGGLQLMAGHAHTAVDIAFACQSPDALVLGLPAGNYSLRDARLYW